MMNCKIKYDIKNSLLTGCPVKRVYINSKTSLIFPDLKEKPLFLDSQNFSTKLLDAIN